VKNIPQSYSENKERTTEVLGLDCYIQQHMIIIGELNSSAQLRGLYEEIHADIELHKAKFPASGIQDLKYPFIKSLISIFQIPAQRPIRHSSLQQRRKVVY